MLNLLLAFSLSLDAMSVALVAGLASRRKLTGVKLALSFGFFQFIMPLLGAFLGNLFAGLSFARYISCLILLAVAFKMFLDALKGKTGEMTEDFTLLWLFSMSVATSLDALGVGVSLKLAGKEVLGAALVIGSVCAVCAYITFLAGAKVGAFTRKAPYIGAFILALIGVSFLI